MLEPAVAVADGQAEQPIPIERGGRAEELDLRRAQLLQVHGDPLEVRLETARDDQVVRNSAGLELDALVLADLDRMVEQLVVVLRLVDPEAAFVDLAGCERRCDAPVLAQRLRRRLERYFDRLGVAPLRQREHARAVEVPALTIEIGAAHRLVECVDSDRERERAARAAHSPRRRRGLRYGQRLATARRCDLNDVAREVAQ